MLMNRCDDKHEGKCAILIIVSLETFKLEENSASNRYLNCFFSRVSKICVAILPNMKGNLMQWSVQ